MTFESPSDPRDVQERQLSVVPGRSESMERVAVLVDQVAERASGGDLLAPAQATVRILSVLSDLGYQPIEVSLEPEKTDEWLKVIMDGDFDVAFNLCETVAGIAAGEYLAAAAVELLELPMTGASAATLLLCLDKDRCSAILRTNGISVPDWAVVEEDGSLQKDWELFPVIVKPAAEDASNGIHPSSIVRSHGELLEVVNRVQDSWGRVLIQEFIEGREINLAIVGKHLLPPAEIDFSTLPDGSPPIVTFAAKWHPDSPEYVGTVPICPAPLPPGKAEQLQRLAARTWQLMAGRGYARVDIRLAEDGTPYVIDINPNPDLSLDAGLFRQARVAGWSYEELIGRIVEEALPSENGDGVADHGWTFVQPQTERIETV